MTKQQKRSVIKIEVESLEVPKEQVTTELENLRTGIKEGYISRRQKLTRELLAVYAHLQHGGKLVDIPLTFSKTGLRKELDLPKLGIVPVGSKICYLYKKRNGSAIFSAENKSQWDVSAKGNDVELPPDTFRWQNLDNDRWKTLAPIIPPRINVEIACRLIPHEYHILYEVEQWNKSSPPRDPILGKMLTKNLFGVLATWDLTELERKIIAGRV